MAAYSIVWSIPELRKFNTIRFLLFHFFSSFYKEGNHIYNDTQMKKNAICILVKITFLLAYGDDS